MKQQNKDLDDTQPEHKAWAKYQQHNAKVLAAILGAQESKDAILGVQDSNQLTLT